MKVGDMVYMRGAQSKRGKFTEDPSHLGIIQDTRFHWGDDKCEYQVKWFYTMAPDFTGYRGPGHWYTDLYLGVYSEVSSVP